MNIIKKIIINPKKFLSLNYLLKYAIGGRLFLLWLRIGRFIPSDKLYLKVFYRLSMHERLDLKNPKTYTQKIQWLKLNNTDPAFSRMVDKYQVREIIREKLGEEYLIPLLGVWHSFDEIDFDKLPEQFVLKTTHDSGTIIICKDKVSLDRAYAKKGLTKALRANYFYKSREYPYKNAIPRIIAETYMCDEKQTALTDYKFFCFNGKPEFVQITVNNDGIKNSGYYNMSFETIPFNTGNALPQIAMPKPQNFDEMIKISELLSQDLLHIRIDLYNVNTKIYFGEFTFHNAGGIIHFDPPEWNKIIGDKLQILY
jgi:hypothetical protein